MQDSAARVDYGLLNHLSDQLLCSRCLKKGIRTRIVQVISRRHRLRSLCRACGAHRSLGNDSGSTRR